jgi:predicted membrane channel-forming protein YqfA (hemolysin III family)
MRTIDITTCALALFLVATVAFALCAIGFHVATPDATYNMFALGAFICFGLMVIALIASVIYFDGYHDAEKDLASDEENK